MMNELEVVNYEPGMELKKPSPEVFKKMSQEIDTLFASKSVVYLSEVNDIIEKHLGCDYRSFCSDQEGITVL